MRIVAIVTALIVLALTGLLLVPEAAAYQRELTIGAAAAAALMCILLIAEAARSGGKQPAKPVAEAVRPAPVAPAHQAEAEVVTFLASLQERGRLVDFLMEDITTYSDAQVGAAARVVHEGCQAALKEHFDLARVRNEGEGTRIKVPAGYAADEYRLVGRISGEPPFEGRLVHGGWLTRRVKLPRVLRTDAARLPTIAPAEVELS